MKRILVAAKPGADEPWLIEPAMQLATDTKAEIVVLVVDDVESQRFTAIPREETLDRARRHAQQLVDRAVESGLKARAEVRAGKAVQTTIAFADGIDADLILVGASGRSIVNRLLGSFAIDLVERAGRQVMVVSQPR